MPLRPTSRWTRALLVAALAYALALQGLAAGLLPGAHGGFSRGVLAEHGHLCAPSLDGSPGSERPAEADACCLAFCAAAFAALPPERPSSPAFAHSIGTDVPPTIREVVADLRPEAPPGARAPPARA